MDINNFKEKQISSKLIFDGKILHVYKDDIELPDGNGAFREYVKHVGAVCVVPVTKEGEVICVNQYRYAIGDMLTEIPAGKLDFRGEDPEQAARRELREETGALSGKLTYMGNFFSSPAILDECIYMYLAEELEFGEDDPDDDEFLEVVRIPIEELVERICRGEIIDGKTQAGVMKAYHIMNLEKKNEA